MEETLEPQAVMQEPDSSPQPDHPGRHPELEAQYRRGVNWFYWIAGLSLVNSVLWLTGAEWGFVIGLGATQVVDALAIAITEEMQAGEIIKFIALGIDIFIAGMYVLIGFLATKRFMAAVIVGMVLYAVDGLLFLLVGDFLSIAFHAFALFCIFSGLKVLPELKRLEAMGSSL